MRLLLLVCLPFVSQAAVEDASSECYTGTIKVGSETLTKDDILTWLYPQVVASVVTVSNSDEQLASFLKTRGNCQLQCLEKVMVASTSTLYGKLGEEFLSQEAHVKSIIVEAVTGAFRACYPFPPREEAVKVAEAIVAGIGVHPPTDKTFPEGVECKNQGKEDDFPLHEFLKSFDEAFSEVMSTKEEMQKVFVDEAKDCQKTCLEDAVPMSTMTLFLTGQDDHDVGIDAVTGAIHACFPGVPEEDIGVLVAAAAASMVDAEKEALQRLQYELDKENTDELEAASFPLVTFAVAVSLALCAGVAIGRRMKNPSVGVGKGYGYEMVRSTVFGYRFD